MCVLGRLLVIGLRKILCPKLKKAEEKYRKHEEQENNPYYISDEDLFE